LAGATGLAGSDASGVYNPLNLGKLFVARGVQAPKWGPRVAGLTFMFMLRGVTMKRLIALVLAATFVLPSMAMLGGCNTVQGAGKDIERGGEKIQSEAKENKKY
jgi:predicted small secreted protein